MDPQEHEAEYGLIILGNSGVGKSFLANTLVGREVFKHEFGPSPVTRKTEFEEVLFGTSRWAIFNMPGLIEEDQKQVDLNIQEIDKAFQLRPKSIIVYVFGQCGGYMRDEEFVAFKAIQAAYPLQSSSLLLVVNRLPTEVPEKYEGSTVFMFKRLFLHIGLDEHNVCFLPCIDNENVEQRNTFSNKFLQVRIEIKAWLTENK